MYILLWRCWEQCLLPQNEVRWLRHSKEERVRPPHPPNLACSSSARSFCMFGARFSMRFPAITVTTSHPWWRLSSFPVCPLHVGQFQSDDGSRTRYDIHWAIVHTSTVQPGHSTSSEERRRWYRRWNSKTPCLAPKHHTLAAEEQNAVLQHLLTKWNSVVGRSTMNLAIAYRNNKTEPRRHCKSQRGSATHSGSNPEDKRGGLWARNEVRAWRVTQGEALFLFYARKGKDLRAKVSNHEVHAVFWRYLCFTCWALVVVAVVVIVAVAVYFSHWKSLSGLNAGTVNDGVYMTVYRLYRTARFWTALDEIFPMQPLLGLTRFLQWSTWALTIARGYANRLQQISKSPELKSLGAGRVPSGHGQYLPT